MTLELEQSDRKIKIDAFPDKGRACLYDDYSFIHTDLSEVHLN